MKRLPGKHLLKFTLFGNTWQVREVPPGHRVLDEDNRGPVWAIVWLNDKIIYLRSVATREQKQTALMHEIEHIIEEHYCIDHELPAPDNDESENRTDKLSLGWLYVIRACPEVVKFVKD
jgi:hypothetical protein